MTAMAATMSRENRGRRIGAGLLLAFRLLSIVVGGYFLSAALTALGAAGLVSLGMDRSEAVVLMSMLGFIIYLLVLIWAFAERRLPRLLAVTLGGTAVGHGLVYWLSMAPPALS
ncbi:hypothetical protein [Oceanibaculum sp.]|uniref:hypothetical protein n=1 Tax=Oceanibaculum sp. TaxID=1903597 RepID=UPI00258E8716|nr:hypothetical protein [Oceanibaculum sp.]MCH2393942.1 hypothetical protein [Oceanibaculum sp.]